MDVPPDPFREGLPDFGDADLNFVRDDIVRGTETMQALFTMRDIYELMGAVLALDEADARVTLTVVIAAWKISVNGERDFATPVANREPPNGDA